MKIDIDTHKQETAYFVNLISTTYPTGQFI